MSATRVQGAEDRDPGVKNKHFQSAVELIRNKEHAAAKALLGLALKDHPDSMALLRASGYCCMKQGQLEEAISFYKKVVSAGEKLKDTTKKELERIGAAKKRLKELAALTSRKAEPKQPEPAPKGGTFKELAASLPGEYEWFQDNFRLGTIKLRPDHTFDGLDGRRKTHYTWAVKGDALELNWGRTEIVFKKIVKRGTYEGLNGNLKIRIVKAGSGGAVVTKPPEPRPKPPRPAEPKTVQRPANIPAGAEKFGDHYYKVYTTRVSWHEAKKRCEAAGGHLACVESKQENDFLTRIAKGRLCFLGGTDSGAEGDWRWINGKSLTFTNWGPNEPNNAHGGEHYLAIVSKGQWNDREAAHRVIKGYICEWGKPPTFESLGDDLAGAYYWYEDGERRGKVALGKGGTIKSFLGRPSAGAKWIVVSKDRLDLKLAGRAATINTIVRPGVFEGTSGGKKITLLSEHNGGRKTAGGDVAFPASLAITSHELDKGACHLSYGATYNSVLLLQGKTLRAFDADGVRLVKKFTLPAEYKKLFSRKSYWVALSDKSVDLIDKATATIKKSVKLETKGVLDLAIHPSLPVSYVTGIDPNYRDPKSPLARRLYFVNEAQGSVKLIPRICGQWLAADPKGRYLYSSLKHVVRTLRGHQNADLIVSYDVRSGWPRPLNVNFQPGQDGKCLRVAPNGSSVSYVSSSGYRDDKYAKGYYIPAFDADDVRRATTAFKTGSRPREVCYHPKLNLVIATSGGPEFFDLKTGEPVASRVDLDGKRLGSWGRFAFSPGGRHLLLECRERSGARKLYSVPLFLTDKEIALLAGKSTRPKIDSTVASKASSGPGAITVPAFKFTALRGGSTKKMSVQEIAKRYKHAVVIIKSQYGAGTGFVIGTEGYILTCAHVLPVFGNPTVIYNLRTDRQILKVSSPATVLRIDDKKDLALIKIKPKGKLTSVRFERVTEASMGEEVSIIGHPGLGAQLLEYTMTTGIVSNPNRTIEGQTYIQTNAAVNPGSSGGPVFNSRGNVIGLVVLKGYIEAVGFAVPKSTISEFLRSATTKQ